MLDNENNQTLNLVVSGNEFIEAGKNEARLIPYQIVFVLIGLMGIGFFIKNFYRLKKSFVRNIHNGK